MRGINQAGGFVLLGKSQRHFKSVRIRIGRGHHLTIDLEAEVDRLDVRSTAELPDDQGGELITGESSEAGRYFQAALEFVVHEAQRR